MNSVVNGHFRALVAQFWQVENPPMGKNDDQESWLEMITFWLRESSTLLKLETQPKAS